MANKLKLVSFEFVGELFSSYPGMEKDDEPLSETNCNSDVIVSLDNGKEYVGSFFTYRNIETLMKRCRKTGECAYGLYICSVGMIIVERLDRTTVERTITDLLETESFFFYFELSDPICLE